MEQPEQNSRFVLYSLNKDPSRVISDEERSLNDGRYTISKDEQKPCALLISSKLWEELKNEKIVYIKDIDNKGRWMKFYSPSFSGEESSLSPQDMGFYRNSLYVIKNGEIKKIKPVGGLVFAIDPYLGEWSQEGPLEIYTTDEG